MADAPVQQPRGREEVVDAVLEAAAVRFAAEGPDASLRDIAADAGVNLGLIHRHVGNKDDLLRAVLAREISGGRDIVVATGSPGAAVRWVFDGARHDGRYIRIIAWLLLRDRATPGHQDRYPAIDALRALATGAAGSDDAVDRDARLALAMAAIYGWTVFGPQLRAAFGYEDEAASADLDARIGELLEALAPPRG